MRAIMILAIGLWLLAPGTALAEVVGHLTQVEGRVELLKGGKLPATAAKMQDGVEPGDVLLLFTDGVSEAMNAEDDYQSLLELAQAGDVEAYGELCRSYEASLIRYAMRLCRDGTLAEDLAQEALVEAWKSLRRYNGKCRFFTWLCAILLNRHRNSLRQKQTIRLSTLTEEDRDEIRDNVGQLADHYPAPDQAAERRDQAALVHQCIRALPPKHQEVIYLRFYVDDSLEGIAAALHCSLGTVKSRLFHALEKLRGMNALSEHLTGVETNPKLL